MSEALAIRPTAAIDIQRDPEEVLAQAAKCAKALQCVVAEKPKPVIINGEQYLELEDWQTLGQFYGYTVRTHAAKPVEIGGVHGAWAQAELVDFRTGEVVGGAESYCMRDEPKWTDRPWFQLSSMAQTRAASKAFRNRLAWIAVLAGYKPTPAEEMTGDEKAPAKQQEHWCTEHNCAFKRNEKDGRTWYSHRTADGWCNERTQEQAGVKVETQPATPRPTPRTEPAQDGELPTIVQAYADAIRQARTIEELEQVAKRIKMDLSIAPQDREDLRLHYGNAKHVLEHPEG